MTTLADPAPSIQSPSPEPARKTKKPSLDKQAEQLTNQMIAELRAMKGSGDAPFPITLRELAQRCGVSDAAVIMKSVGKKSFKSHAVVVISSRSKHKSRQMDAYVCLKDDMPRLAATDKLLQFAFELACSGNCKLFTPAQLQNHLASTADFHKTFKQTVDARLKDDSLPETIGYLPKDARTNYLFRLSDIQPVRGTNAQTASVPPESEAVANATSPSPTATPDVPTQTFRPTALDKDFAAEFETAFARLDREGGSHNFVKIADLRRALPEFDRTEFDRGVWQLRKQRKFTANSSDGNYEQLAPEDRSAGIREGDSLLIYISRL